MSLLPEPTAERVGKLIRLLSSDKDAEVVASARALKRTLESAGTDLHGLAKLIEERIRKTENALHGSGEFRDIDGNPDWHEIAKWCQRRANRLNEKECKFVDDMTGHTAWREPTEKQGKWLMSIFLKLGGPA
jgi:hypothetical protein